MKKEHILFLIIIFITIFQIYSFKDFFVDDSYITFRYSKNLVNGKGLVFNEGEKVEGITNFLFAILIAIGIALKIDPLIFSRIISILSLIGIYFLIYKISFSYFKDKYKSQIPLLFISLFSPIFFWVNAGLEAVFFSFLILLLVYLEIKNNSSFFYILTHVLLFTTRPEGFAISGIIWIFRFLKKEKNFLKIFLIFFAFSLLYLTFKFLYYGSLIPNTFYAKVLGPKAKHQTFYFLKEHIHLFLILCAFFFIKNKNLLLMLIISIFFLIQPEILGGDIMPYWRFYVHTIHLILILISYFILNIKNSIIRNSLIVFFILSSINSALFTKEKVFAILSMEITKAGIESGKFLKEKLSENSVVAANAIGAISYYSDLKIIDMLGLCDRHIARKKASGEFHSFAIAPAHSKGDGLYVFNKNPDVIFFGNTAGSGKPVYTSDFELLKIKEFKEKYVLKKFVIMKKERDFNILFPSMDKNFYRRLHFIAADWPVKDTFYTRFDIGLDIYLDFRGLIPKGKAKSYCYTLRIYVKKTLPIANLPDGESIFPPPLYPEEYYNARDFQDAGIWAAAEGRYREAEYYLNKSLLLSNNFYTHFLLGKVYFLAGEISSGIREMEEALKQKPDFPEALAELSKYKK